MATYYEVINWDAIKDVIDKSIWEKLIEQFWLDTRVPLSNDLDDWRTLSGLEKTAVGYAFSGLTLLGVVQSESGMGQLRSDVRTSYEKAILSDTQFMEFVHVKSYSSILSTLNTKKGIDDIFEWTNTSKHLQYKVERINEIYKNGTLLEKKIASISLGTFLFYSGFYTLLYYLGDNKLADVAEIVKLIIRDESIHGMYIGCKSQLGFSELSENEQDKPEGWMYNSLYELYENEERYTEKLYDDLGWTEEVETSLHYNTSKALMNLGMDPLPADTANGVNSTVTNGILTGTSNHDFFSQVGNGYSLGTVEAMKDDDYPYGLNKQQKARNDQRFQLLTSPTS